VRAELDALATELQTAQLTQEPAWVQGKTVASCNQ
jgi:hypothetical protein